MTTQQRIENIEKELSELKIQLQEETNQKLESPKSYLLDLLGNELTVKIDIEKFPNSVFYFKDDICLLELEKRDKTMYLWCNYSKIWNPISSEYYLNYTSIQSLIKETIEEHFKMSDVTPERKGLYFISSMPYN